ncbi:hypothetical protein ACFL6S_30940 [Candidatus Poribacteria bacterium]
MSLYESKQYLTVYEDDDYMVWVDTVKGVVSVFLREKELTIHFSYEDFCAFRESVNSMTPIDMDDAELSEVYMEERGIGLYFDHEEFHIFRDILNNLEIMSRWFLCWN